MSSIITSILSSTVGLLWNKARDKTANKLKDGDITDAKVREIVVRELDDIKTKLDGLSRKDLHSSYCFLQEGVDLLNKSLNKSKLEQKALLNEARDDGRERARMSGNGESGILNEALELSDAMRRVRLDSDKELESAKKRFEDARRRATDAFCNEALSTQDRIFAAKVRIISEILEHLESPETAITGCMSFLKKLHSLPAIQDTFSVYLKGGMKSLFNKAERVENVKSVMLINQVLFHYCSKFGSGNYAYMAWPAIEIASDRSFQPVLSWSEVSTRKSMDYELKKPPNGLERVVAMDPKQSAVNSQGSIVNISTSYNVTIRVISTTHETKTKASLPNSTESGVTIEAIVGLAFDNNDNVYYVAGTATKTLRMKNYVLYVLDENYIVKHSRILDFLRDTDTLSFVHRYQNVMIAVNKNNDIIMTKREDSHVYVCDNNGNFKHKFERDSRYAGSLSNIGENEILLADQDSKSVKIFTEDGNLKLKIEVPIRDEDYNVIGAAFHHVLCKIIVLTHIYRSESLYFLHCFSEKGKLETSTYFCERKDFETNPMITSHPSGPVAVVRERSITFI